MHVASRRSGATSSRRSSIMWKRERTTRSPSLASAASMRTWPTRWLVSHSGACDQAFGCGTRPMPDHHQVACPRRRSTAPFPLGLLRRRRHPVDAVVGEQVDECLPVLAVEQLGLAVEELLDLALRIAAVRRTLCEPRSSAPRSGRASALACLRRPSVRPRPCTGPGLELVAHRRLRRAVPGSVTTPFSSRSSP